MRISFTPAEINTNPPCQFAYPVMFVEIQLADTVLRRRRRGKDFDDQVRGFAAESSSSSIFGNMLPYISKNRQFIAGNVRFGE